MAEDDELSDINSPGHFATREVDRGDKGTLTRLFDALDEAGKQELLRYAIELRRKPKAP